MAKRKRSEFKEKDLISKFPDEVLSLIVSRLPLREAVRTSILSKRWRHVWTLVSKLEFDAVNLGRRASGFCNLIHHNQDKFVELVNQVLQLHQSRTIESFKLHCQLGPEHSSQIDKWLQIAVNRSLQNLDINMSFSYEPHSTPYQNCYKIPHWIFDGRLLSLKRLSLAHCCLEIPPIAICFSSLASLTLASTLLSQDNVNIILSHCPNIQNMSLLGCICPSHLELASQNQFLPLKRLVIVNCKYLTALSIFDAVGLLSFECLDTELSLLALQNTAKPVDVCLDFRIPSFLVPWQNFHRLAAGFPKLGKLMLILPQVEPQAGVMLQCLQQLPTFDRLQELVLDCWLQWSPFVLKIISSWLKASRHLQKLRLIQPDRRHKKIASWPEEYLHENLREAALYNFKGTCSERILVKYLLKTATALEKIKIYRNSRIYLGNGRRKKRPSFSDTKEVGQKNLKVNFQYWLNQDPATSFLASSYIVLL